MRDYAGLRVPLHVDFNFGRGTTRDYGVSHMLILTLGRGLQGTTGLLHVDFLTLGSGLQGTTGSLTCYAGLRGLLHVDCNLWGGGYRGLRGLLHVDFNFGRGTTGEYGVPYMLILPFGLGTTTGSLAC